MAVLILLRGGALRIATIARIPVRVHWSFLVLLGGYAAFSGAMLGMTHLAITLVVAAALFATVVLHELGHALMARYFGIETAHITLYPFGGIAAIARMPTQPSHELAIALAGPAVNFVLGSAFLVAYLATGALPLLVLVAINAVMGGFNLLPAFPMDGGRVLRALLTGWLGFVPASRIALTLGRVFAWLFFGVGLYTWNPSLVLVSLFLHFAVSAERRRLAWAIQKAEFDAWLARGGWERPTLGLASEPLRPWRL